MFSETCFLLVIKKTINLVEKRDAMFSAKSRGKIRFSGSVHLQSSKTTN